MQVPKRGSSGVKHKLTELVKGSIQRQLVTAVVLLLVLWRSTYPAGTAADNQTSRTYVSLRQEGVVIQTDWTTCGPAAVATLLSTYFGIPAAEADIIALARPHLPENVHPTQSGYTMGSLREALRDLGLVSEGYRMDLAALVNYQRQVGLPVIVHLALPRPHFAVLVGSRDGRFLLADPSWGMAVEREEAFAASWSGFILVTLPPPDRAAEMHRRVATALETYLVHRPPQLFEATRAWP